MRRGRDPAGQQGSALLMVLVGVLVAAVAGFALFELGVIEAGLVTRDIAEVQGFYCAEAQAARIYNLYDLFGDPAGTAGPLPASTHRIVLAGTTYVATVSVAVDAATGTVTATATCALPDGRTRTVQRQGTRVFLPFESTGASLGYACPTCPQAAVGDLNLGGAGSPVRIGGPMVGGADVVNGDVYVAGRALLRGESTITGYSSSDSQATVTLFPGGALVDESSAFDGGAPGVQGTGTYPRPNITNAQGTGVLDQIKASVTNPDLTPKMKSTWGGSTVYNLDEIFRQLGEVNQGNSERNLARPAGCTFGVASANEQCRIWQDLAIIGPKRTCGAPSDCAGVAGPTDRPSYYFMGLPRSPSVSPQQTSFATIFAAAVNASAELQQLGFVADSYASLGSRLDQMLGTSPSGEGRVSRLVDLTVGVDPATGHSVVREAPPIFYVDGYWRVDGGTSFAYNGRGTVVATKSIVLSDNLLYLGSTSNVNLTLPPSSGPCQAPASDRTLCGLADVLGLVAQDDVWFGDPGPSGSTLHEVHAFMVAGRDANMFDYSSAGSCCKGTANPVAFTGSLVATREFSMIRDWAYPAEDRGGANQDCNAAGGGGCKPVALFRFNPANPAQPHPWCTAGGWTECWLFMTLDAHGALVPDASLQSKAFGGGCETPAVPLTSPCPSRTRRITHFQLVATYDARLRTTPGLAPPGFPSGGTVIYRGLAGSGFRWRDCGASPSCS